MKIAHLTCLTLSCFPSTLLCAPGNNFAGAARDQGRGSRETGQGAQRTQPQHAHARLHLEPVPAAAVRGTTRPQGAHQVQSHQSEFRQNKKDSQITSKNLNQY
jgi:hypothetical protein